MKLRINQWLDMSNPVPAEYKIQFCIQARINNKWVNCHENGTPLFFDTPFAAFDKIHEIQAAHKAIGMSEPTLIDHRDME